VTFEGHFKYSKLFQRLYFKNTAYIMFEVNYNARTSYVSNNIRWVLAQVKVQFRPRPHY